MSITKGELANRILRLMGVNTRFVEAAPEQVIDTLKYVDDWMMANDGMGRRLGWAQEDEPNPDTPTNLPNWAIMGVSNSMAVYMCPFFEKQIHPSLMINSAIGMQTISDNTISNTPIQFPNTMPLGQGNRTTYGQRYYTKDDRISTEGDFLLDDSDSIVITNGGV